MTVDTEISFDIDLENTADRSTEIRRQKRDVDILLLDLKGNNFCAIRGSTAGF